MLVSSLSFMQILRSFQLTFLPSTIPTASTTTIPTTIVFIVVRIVNIRYCESYNQYDNLKLLTGCFFYVPSNEPLGSNVPWHVRTNRARASCLASPMFEFDFVFFRLLWS